MLTPVVTGEIDPGALTDLVRLCVELAGHGHCGGCAEPGQADPAGESGQDPEPNGNSGRGR